MKSGEVVFCRCNRWAFVDYPGKQVFPPDTVERLGVIKESQGGPLRFSGLVSVTDRLREAQKLVFT